MTSSSMVVSISEQVVWMQTELLGVRQWSMSPIDNAEAIILIDETSETRCCNQIDSNSDFFSWIPFPCLLVNRGLVYKSCDGQIMTEQEAAVVCERQQPQWTTESLKIIQIPSQLLKDVKTITIMSLRQTTRIAAENWFHHAEWY